MAPEAALAFVKGAVNGERELVTLSKATRSRNKLGLDTYDQEEVLLAIEPGHFDSQKPAKRKEYSGFQYSWRIPWRVPTDDGRTNRDCVIYVKFCIPSDESLVWLTSFKDENDSWG